MYIEASENVNTQAILALLMNHYGDGTVYLPYGASSNVLLKAIENEYISEEGFLTRKGRKLIAKHRY